MSKKFYILILCLGWTGIQTSSVLATQDCNELLKNCVKGNNCAPFGSRGQTAWDECNKLANPMGKPRKEACEAGCKLMEKAGQCQQPCFTEVKDVCSPEKIGAQSHTRAIKGCKDECEKLGGKPNGHWTDSANCPSGSSCGCAPKFF